MKTRSVIHHGEPTQVQVLGLGEQVFWNGHRCHVSVIYTDGDVQLTEVSTGKLYIAFAGFCTTMAQAN